MLLVAASGNGAFLSSTLEVKGFLSGVAELEVTFLLASAMGFNAGFAAGFSIGFAADFGAALATLALDDFTGAMGFFWVAIMMFSTTKV
jgi:hypothetical protein